MLKNKSIFSNIIDFAVLTVLTFAYILCNFSLTLQAIFSIILIITVYRRDIKNTVANLSGILLSVIIASLFVKKVAVYDIAIHFLNLCVLPVSVGYAFKKSLPYINTVCVGAFANVAVSILEFLKLKYADGLDISAIFIKQPIMDSLSLYGDILSSYGISANDIVNSFTGVAPSLLIISSIAGALLLILIAKKMIEHIYKSDIGIGSFSEIRLKRSTAIVLAIAVIIIFFGTGGVVYDALLNIVIILFSAFFICGMSFIDYYFRKTGLWGIVRIIIYFCCFVIAMILSVFTLGILNPFFIITFVGMSDSITNYRKLQ